MASDAEIRAWARERDIPVSGKGKVGPAVREQYNAAHNGDTFPPPADYPDGMTDAMFETADAAEPPDLEDTGEERPRPVPKSGGSRSTGERLTRAFKRGSQRGRPRAKKTQPRVSTVELIGSTWRILAKVAAPMPPLYRTLRLQSVVAGPLLDDAVKGTVVDPFLQPLARLTQVGETVAALVAAPAGIGAMAVHVQTAASRGAEPNPVVLQMCAEVTRHGFLAMMRVGGDRFAAQVAREQDEQERYGQSVDAIMAWVMAPPADPAAEDEALRQMAARLAGQPDPADTMAA